MIKQMKPADSVAKRRGIQQKSHPARTAQKPRPQGRRAPDQPGAAGFASARADEDTYD